MAKEKKLVSEITSMEEDFAKWYTDVVKKAELMEYSSLKGFMILKPRGYAIWENIRERLDARFKACGVENVYMPLLIPESLLQKEKDHVEGFAPEVAWVTRGGKEELAEKLCIRPTSETIFCDFYKNNIQSYRDLPKLYNQWCSVVRWEKTTRPFLRSSEFLWQEGHTAHATDSEAEEFTLKMLHIYRDFCREELAIPVICGKKTDKEKFAGAKSTYTIEALMHDGKALQSGTSHNFGDGFARAFNIQYLNRENTLSFVHQTSWGVSTRLIGAIIMVHGDDSGLVMPPRIAPVQAMIVPIRMENDKVKDTCERLKKDLISKGIRVKEDFTDKSPGWKFAESEMVGVPIRIEVGPKDIENDSCILVRRDNGEKISASLNDLGDTVVDLLDKIHSFMYEKAKNHLESHIYDAYDFHEFQAIAEGKPGLIRGMWCESEECEEKIKESTQATSRCISREEAIGDKCVCCGKPAKTLVYWGKAY